MPTRRDGSPRMRIFIILDWYLPGYRSGGPVRSIANLVERLGTHFEFFIVTRNCDFRDSTPYRGIPLDRWMDVGRGNVSYTRSIGLSTVRRCIREVQPDVIYLNSLFAPSTLKVLLLRLFRLIPPVPFLLAARGQLSPGALSIKPGKKSAYLRIVRWAGLYNGLSWHATSEAERQDISRTIHPTGYIYFVPNLPSANVSGASQSHKSSGNASFIFVSRLSPKKNLQFALRAFLRLPGTASFDIYGPVDDLDYWQTQCVPLVNMASGRLQIAYHGPIPNGEVPALLASRHFFVLPTLDENFGHAIVEAMMAGCPPVTSDRTPWRGLAEHGVGWDLPLDALERWTEVMQECVDMDQDAYAKMSGATRSHVLSCLHVDQIERDMAEMFREVAGGSRLVVKTPAAKSRRR